MPETTGSRKVWQPAEGGTIDEHWCSLTVTDAADWKDCMTAEYAGNVYDLVFAGVARYPGNANGALRRYAPIEERGFKKFSAMVPGGYYQDGRDVYNRHWWVYLPETVDAAKPYPVVFVFHGAGGSADEIADRTGWGDLAQKYGFMIICPMASVPNRVRHVTNIVTKLPTRCSAPCGIPAPPSRSAPNDMQFVDFLYNWLTEKLQHRPQPGVRQRPVLRRHDELGLRQLSRPDLFTATAPVSAKDINFEGETLPFRGWLHHSRYGKPGPAGQRL